MIIKLFRNLKTNLFVLMALTLFLVFAFSINSSAQTQSKPKILTLTIKLEDEFNPNFKLCMPIEADVPIEVSWTKGEIKSSISALLRKPEGEFYRVKFTLKEGTAESTIYNEMVEPKLKLEKIFEQTFIASSVFENYYTKSLLLSKKACK